MGKYQGYEKYKDSGVEWLGEIPEHWEVKKLKFVATVQPSNVDKKTLDDEAPVLLCNYSDVYNHEWITDEIEFMKATATSSEIKKFLIKKGDIIITKDSERADDIAVPALIAQDFDDVVCGYHLTQIKPKELDGNFLFRLFQCTRFNAQFVVSANGVTRFGLPQRAVNDAFVGFPPLEEQNAIAQFLDHKTSQIDALISKKEALLEKLDEKRTALISHAVTKGLDPTVPMKDSGIEWLGDIPAHWTLTRLRFLVSKIEQGWSPSCHNHQAEEGEWGVLKAGCVNGEKFNASENKSLPDELEPKTQYEIIDGDILMSRANTKELLGSAAIVVNPRRKLILCDKLYRLSAKNNINRKYLVRLLRSSIARLQYEKDATGSSGSMQNIGQDTIKNLILPLPPLVQQNEIANYLDKTTEGIEQQKAKIKQAIDLLKEYRTALITNAVTGKIDVRQVPIPQP